MIRKIVIPPTNTKAIAFLEALSRKKEAIKRMLEAKSLDKVNENGIAIKRTGK